MSDGSEAPPACDPLDNYLSEIKADRRWRAFHEAGHVVAAWALGALSVKADILEKPPGIGVAVYMLGADGRGCTVQDTIVCSAGMSAAKRHAPRFQDGGEQDRVDIARNLRALCRADDAADIVRAHCRAEADRLIAANWDAVEAVASALLEHEAVSYDAVDAVFAGVVEARAEAEWRRKRRDRAELVTRAESPIRDGSGAG